MNLRDLIVEVMENLNFNKLEKREYENKCDFNSTLEHYKSVIKDKIKEKSEYFTEEEFSINNDKLDEITKEIQEMIDNDYTYKE